ncbi:MAG: beta strand repeat-containing protein [Candidatus Sulfotelmatobacter sp.]
MYKRYAGLLAFLLPLGFLLGCGSSSNSSSTSPSTPTQAETIGITASGGSAQSAAGGKPFAAPLAATVTTNGVVTGGESVTFAAPTSGPSGTFANGSTSETDATDDNGVAKSSTFTANSVAGAYTVTATVTGVSTPVTFSLANISTTSYSFYMSGEDSNSAFYALAGAIVVDTNGNVLGGEQDYNDGVGITSAEPKGDQISGGTLTVSGTTGQGTLTLNTNNTNLGVNADGVEIFGVQFVNYNHALITQFDGFATSSGSMDLQTLGTPAAVASGGYAFALSGIDAADDPLGFGGVFSLNAGAISNGVLDINDSFNTGLPAVTGTAFTGTVSSPDSYGRGTITGIKIPQTPVSLNYYLVGPEVLRIVNVNGTSTAIGSAFGQGSINGAANTFTNASLGQSVFTVTGNYSNLNDSPFAAVGQFTTDSASTNFSGIADDSEPNNFGPDGVVFKAAESISGTYSIASNGYGSVNLKTNGNSGQGLGDITSLGIYLTDPLLNLSDPNNSTGGGGALIVDLDSGVPLTGTQTFISLAGGIGVIVPQTDISSNDFAGNYAAGWQIFNYMGCFCEFDMVAQGSMVGNGSLTLNGLVSDPEQALSSFTGGPTESSGDTFAGAPLADANNPGRYTMTKAGSSIASVIDGTTITPNFQSTVYQASGGQLFWLGWDQYDQDHNGGPEYVWVGPIEQQNSTGLPAGRKPAAKGKTKH